MIFLMFVVPITHFDFPMLIGNIRRASMLSSIEAGMVLACQEADLW